ncbi:MAG: hypothetical protein WD076_09245 [Parvularculaceae bacterium]
MKHILAGAAGAIAFAGAAHAAIIVIDFDSVAAGTVITNQYAGVTISGANPPINEAVTFDSDNPTGGDPDLGQPLAKVGGDNFGSGPANNVLILSEDGDLGDPDDDGVGGVFTFDFDDVIDFLGFDAIDITDQGANLLVRLYAADDSTLIFSFNFATSIGAVVGDNQYWSLFGSIFGMNGVADVGLAEIEITGSGAIDNLTYDPIPAPAALPLLLTGLAGLGFAARRAKRS